MINFILWLLFGALVGWLASIVMRTDAQQGALLNIIVGIIGAMLGGFLFNMLGIGGANINNSDFSLSALVVSYYSRLTPRADWREPDQPAPSPRQRRG